MMSVITVQLLVRNTKVTKPRYIFKIHFRQFDEQAFLHDLYHNIDRVSLIPDVDSDYFCMKLVAICDKHAPFEEM